MTEIDITKHTPTPWIGINAFVGTEETDTQTICYMDDHRNRRARSSEETKANAAFIVTACNAYDANQETIRQQAEQIKALREALEHTCWTIENGYFEDESIGAIFGRKGRAVLDQTKGE